MKYLVFLGISLLFFSANAQTNASFNHNGVNRTFVYYTPSSWSPSVEMPLLIVMHGLTQTGNGLMNITDFNAIAEANSFIVCYPDGINNAWNANMNLTVSTADDMGFIETLATYFQTNFNTNPLKQYLCGFSNGGFMSHKIACESSMCFAAIATVSGNMSDTTYANCNPQFSPAVLHIHGTADLVVPYNGGSGTGVSVDQTMEKWRSFLGCNTSPNIVDMPNTNLIDLSLPQRIIYSNCTSPLELIKITGGGHQWPGINTLVGGAGTINMDFYSPQVIWDFLSGKSCPSSAALEEETKPLLKVYPNPVNDLLTLSTEEAVAYEISDLHGRCVMTGKAVKTIDVGQLNAGIYVLRIVIEKQHYFVRFVK